MNERVKCRECKELILREEAIEYEKEYLCQGCFEDEYTVCGDCGCIVPGYHAAMCIRRYFQKD